MIGYARAVLYAGPRAGAAAGHGPGPEAQPAALLQESHAAALACSALTGTGLAPAGPTVRPGAARELEGRVPVPGVAQVQLPRPFRVRISPPVVTRRRPSFTGKFKFFSQAAGT
jgi:hypothetical protein